jgi:hypothetical protein
MKKGFIYVPIAMLLLLTGCNKEEKRRYSFAGVWEVTQIRQEVRVNGELTEEAEYSDVGFLEFRYPQSGAITEDNGAFWIENTTVPIIAFQELNNETIFSWHHDWDDHRLALIYYDSFTISTYSLTFTITKNKRKEKELFFVYTEYDASGNYIENMEYYTLELVN